MFASCVCLHTVTAYHDLATFDVTTAAQCRRLCGFETEYFGVGGPKEKFPVVLYALLEKAEDDNFNNVISWQSHGRAFRIHDHVALEKEVLPKYLRRPIKYVSFQRQLHLYGFLQLPFRGLDAGCYYHECFLRGRPDLCSLMQRSTKSTCHVRQSRDASTAPNFASMLTTEAASALRLSNASNGETPNIMLQPKPTVEQGSSHDDLCLSNVTEGMFSAPPATALFPASTQPFACRGHQVMFNNAPPPIQCSLPDPGVAPGVGNGAAPLEYMHTVTDLDNSIREFLRSLPWDAQHAEMEHVIAPNGPTTVDRTLTHTSTPNDALEKKNVVELDTSTILCAAPRDERHHETDRSSPNVAPPFVQPAAAVVETTSIQPCNALVVANDELSPSRPIIEKGETKTLEGIKGHDSTAVLGDETIDFTMTDALQAVLAEIK